MNAEAPFDAMLFDAMLLDVDDAPQGRHRGTGSNCAARQAGGDSGHHDLGCHRTRYRRALPGAWRGGLPAEAVQSGAAARKARVGAGEEPAACRGAAATRAHGGGACGGAAATAQHGAERVPVNGRRHGGRRARGDASGARGWAAISTTASRSMPGRCALRWATLSDKGMPAALFMARTRSLLRATTAAFHGRHRPPSHPGGDRRRDERRVVARTIRSACSSRCSSVSSIWRMAVLRYVNAGHVRPFLLHAGQPAVELACPNDPPLGVIETVRFRNNELHVAPGDGMVIVSDGVPDMINAAGDELRAGSGCWTTCMRSAICPPPRSRRRWWSGCSRTRMRRRRRTT